MATGLACPFCGAPVTDRIAIEGATFLVFRCLFTPRIDPAWTEEETERHLRTDYAGGGASYFRGMCDRLHLYVTKGEGARALGAADAPPD
jgi:hypothetical protein